MKYRYSAVENATGKKLKGLIEAENETDAIYQLRGQNLSPISVSPFKEKAAHFWEIEIMEPEVHKLKMKKKDLMQFADKMAIMLRAGVTLSMAMDVIVTSEKDRRYKKIYRAILTDLYGGSSLADSMQKFKAFPEVVVNMVASGEKTGKLDWAFSRIATLYEKQMALSGKVSSAFTYPLFLVALAVILFVVMTIFVLPRFTGMYDQFGGELPGVTQAMISMSDFMLNWGWLLILIIGAIAGTLVLLLKLNPKFSKWVAQITLKVPVLGRLSLVSNTCNFSNITTALLQAGVEVVEAVRVSAAIIKNKFIRTSVTSSLESVEQGSTLASAFQKLNIFEPLFISMIQIGEGASMLPDTFQKMADLYEAESNEATKKLTSVLEPILTVCIGLMIATMVVAIILPMFNMYSVILE